MTTAANIIMMAIHSHPPPFQSIMSWTCASIKNPDIAAPPVFEVRVACILFQPEQSCLFRANRWTIRAGALVALSKVQARKAWVSATFSSTRLSGGGFAGRQSRDKNIQQGCLAVRPPRNADGADVLLEAPQGDACLLYTSP